METTVQPYAATGDLTRAPALPPDTRVEIVGLIPPPYGGVTIHCARLLDHLTRLGITARLWDLGGRSDTVRHVHPYAPNELRHALNNDAPTVVHWHKMPDARAMRQMFTDRWHRDRRRTAIVMSFHNSRITAQAAAQPIFKQAAIRWFVRRCNAIIFTGEEGRQQGLMLGCPPERCFIASPFIPPPPETLRPELLPPRVRAFIASHHPVLSAFAWTVDFTEGVEIYGIDLLVEAMGRLIGTRPDLGLVLRLSQTQHPEYVSALKARAETLGVARNILWMTEQIDSGAAIWKAADVFLRPTCTDGDALSVREALHMGVPVIASDAVGRPAGCRIFRNRDIDSLVATIEETLDHIEVSAHMHHAGEEASASNQIEPIIAVYAHALTGIR